MNVFSKLRQFEGISVHSKSNLQLGGDDGTLNVTFFSCV